MLWKISEILQASFHNNQDPDSDEIEMHIFLLFTSPVDTFYDEQRSHEAVKGQLSVVGRLMTLTAACQGLK